MIVEYSRKSGASQEVRRKIFHGNGLEIDGVFHGEVEKNGTCIWGLSPSSATKMTRDFHTRS